MALVEKLICNYRCFLFFLIISVGCSDKQYLGRVERLWCLSLPVYNKNLHLEIYFFCFFWLFGAVQQPLNTNIKMSIVNSACNTFFIECYRRIKKKLEKAVEWQNSLKSWRQICVDHKPSRSCGEWWGAKPNKHIWRLINCRWNKWHPDKSSREALMTRKMWRRPSHKCLWWLLRLSQWKWITLSSEGIKQIGTGGKTVLSG